MVSKSKLVAWLDARLGVATFEEAAQTLGPQTLAAELDVLPEGEIEVISIIPDGILAGRLDSTFLLRRGAELGTWI